MSTTADTHAERATRWLGLVAADVMQTNVITISDSAPFSEVDRVLSENRISGVPVTDQSGRVIGVISMRDLIDRIAEDPDVRPDHGPGYYGSASEPSIESIGVVPETEETARSLMNPEIYDVRSDTPVHAVAAKMVERGIHRVLVTDEASGHVVGIITSMGVLAAVSA